MSRTDKADDVALQLEEADTSAQFEDIKPVYVAEYGSSHKKTKAERRFITKCDLVIVPLGALLYFVAYVVSDLAFRQTGLPIEYIRSRIGTALEMPASLDMACRLISTSPGTSGLIAFRCSVSAYPCHVLDLIH